MKTTVGQLRVLIKEALNEMNGPRGGLRRVRGPGGLKHKLGKIEDENRELSSIEAEMEFPESTEAWTEIVPEFFPDFPFDDARAIKKHSAWYRINGKLRVAFKDIPDMPQVELMQWDSRLDDWVDLEESGA